MDPDRKQMPPTQIGRTLRELNITWIAAAQDRLVKEMRVAGVKTLEKANRYLRDEFLPWSNRTLTAEPASADDAHRKLDKPHDLAAILSHVETRQVKGNYTVPLDGGNYVIAKGSICTGLRGGTVRVEWRMDGTIAMRFKDRYLDIELCREPVKTAATAKKKPAKRHSGQTRSNAPEKHVDGRLPRQTVPLTWKGD